MKPFIVYTVSFAQPSGAFEISRFFNTKLAAMKWAKWLANLRPYPAVKVHRGQAGGELIAELRRPT